MKSKSRKQSMVNGSPIHMGDFLGVAFEEGVVRYVMVSDVRRNSVVATILEEAGRNYPQGRSMAISLEYVRERRSKDNPPPLWGVERAA